ncbi:MAG: hypothetical protein Q7R92_05670 [bacterium]|nr:hypothetical protein [bacterium]
MSKIKLLKGMLVALSVMALTIGFTVSAASADSGSGRDGNRDIRIRLNDNNLFDQARLRVRLEARNDGLRIRREVRLEDNGTLLNNLGLNGLRLNDLRLNSLLMNDVRFRNVIDARLLNEVRLMRNPLLGDTVILQNGMLSGDLLNSLALRRAVLFPDRVEIRQEIRR